MGRKRVGKRKYFLGSFAVLTCIVFIGCASIKEHPIEPPMLLEFEPIQPAVEQAQPKKEQQRDDSKELLLQGQKLLAMGQFDASIKENLKVLSIAPNGPPGDEAMFTIGLIYANPKYQKKDYGKSITSLTRIIKEFPQSRWSGQARILLDIIQENEKLKRISAEANQENEKLKSIIEQSKKVDLEVEEKKREKAR